jgi:hypothetical protein
VDLSSTQDQRSALSYGLDVRGHALVTDTIVDKADSYGMYAKSAEIVSSTFSNNNNIGVILYGNDASSVSYCDVTDNGSHGVYGPTTGTNSLDVSYNNVTGNKYYGVVYARALDNNYIADNYSKTGADTTSKGTVDGTLDVSSSQIGSIDAVTNPKSSSVSGTGPASGS